MIAAVDLPAPLFAAIIALPLVIVAISYWCEQRDIRRRDMVRQREVQARYMRRLAEEADLDEVWRLPAHKEHR